MRHAVLWNVVDAETKGPGEIGEVAREGGEGLGPLGHRAGRVVRGSRRAAAASS